MRAHLEEHSRCSAPIPKPESRDDDLEEDLEAGDYVRPGPGADTGASGEDETPQGEDEDGEDLESDEVDDIGGAINEMQLDPPTVYQGHIVAYPRPDIAIANKPTCQGISAAELIETYRTPDLIPLINRFLEKLGCREPVTILNLFNVYRKLSLTHPPPSFAPNDPVQRDVIRAYPAARTTRGHINRDERFDTAIFLDQPNEFGIHRYRAGRVRAIFTLPSHVYSAFPHHLAYVELFTPFGQANNVHGMHSTSHALLEGKRRATLIPITDIAPACHLAPRFRFLPEGTVLNSRSDLMSTGKRFYLNHYYSHHMRQFIEYWRHLTPAAG